MTGCPYTFGLIVLHWNGEWKVKYQYCQMLPKHSTRLKVDLILCMAHFMWVSGHAALRPLCRRESVSRPVSLPDQTHIHLCLPGCWWPLLSGVKLTFTLASVNSLALHPRPPSLCGQSEESVLARDDDEHLGEFHPCASQSQRVHTEGFKEAIKLPKFLTQWWCFLETPELHEEERNFRFNFVLDFDREMFMLLQQLPSSQSAVLSLDSHLADDYFNR